MKGEMLFVVSLLLLLVVGMFLLTQWWDGEVRDFTDRCLDAGGSQVQSYGTSMASYVCLTHDGRIIVDVEGPGL